MDLERGSVQPRWMTWEREYAPQRGRFERFGFTDGESYRVKAAFTGFHGENNKDKAGRSGLICYVFLGSTDAEKNTRASHRLL